MIKSHLVMSLALLVLIPFFVLDVQAQSTSRDNVQGLNNNYVYFLINTTSAGQATIIADGKYTYSDDSTNKGHIYIPSGTTISNDLFVAGDIGKTCVEGIVIPSSIADFEIPTDVSNGTAYGFAYANHNDKPSDCVITHPNMTLQFDVDNTLQVVLYDQSGKEGYSYLRAAGITTSQDIVACTNSNFDDTSKSLRGNTKHCYKDVGSDLVVYTKVMQFYGAKMADDSGDPEVISTTGKKGIAGLDQPRYAPFKIKTTGAGTGVIESSGSGKYTYSSTNTTKGHIYIPPSTTISNDLFVAGDTGKRCVHGTVISSEDEQPNFAIPSDVHDGTAYGFAYLNDATSNPQSCTLRSTNLTTALDVDNTLQVVLYDQAGNTGYSYLRTADITTAQDIVACTTANFDNTAKTLKGNTKMCYADVGNDLVIYTKVMQWYGAKENPLSRKNVNGIGGQVFFDIKTTDEGAATIDSHGRYTYTASSSTPHTGHIYIPPDTTISNDLFVAGDTGKACVRGTVIPSDFNSKFATPSGISNGKAYGFDYANDVASGNPKSCTLRNTAISTSTSLETNNVLRVVLYDQAGKEGYSYLRAAGITTSQGIPECNDTLFNNTAKTLLGSTKFCHADVGTDLVIYTKVMQWYGAKDKTVATPDPNPDPSKLLNLPVDNFPRISDTALRIYVTPTTSYLSAANDAIADTTVVADRIGHIYFLPNTDVLSNPILPTVTTAIGCAADVSSVKSLLGTSKVQGLTVPNNILPQGNSSIVAMGLDFIPNTECSVDFEDSSSTKPLITSKELRFTLYGKSEKTPYYFSPRENVTVAQQINACTNNTLGFSDQTLKGNTMMCYGKNGTDMIIITKRLSGFYGAADNVTAAPIPIDPNTGTPVTPARPGDDTPEYVALLKRLYLPAV